MLAVLVLFAASAEARPVPDGGRATGSATRQQVNVVVGLRWRNQAQLEELLRQQADPESSQYGRYLTSAEFASRFAPTAATVESTRLILRDHGLGLLDVSPSGLFLTASGWVVDVTATRNALLTALRDLTQEVRLYFYVTLPQSSRGAGGGAASGDESVEMRPPLRVTRLVPRGSETAFTPAMIARAYGFDALYARGIDGRNARSSTIAIASAYGFDRADLRSFWADHGIARSDDRVEVIWVGGESAINHVETTVDVQWASSLAPDSPVIVYAAPQPTTDRFLQLYDRITTDNRAGILVTSWGACEKQLSRTYLEQAHILFQRAAAQGMTVIAASGDRGANDCDTSELSVDFPASDPNVLAVGGTRLRNDGIYSNETAWSGSGGGTSAVWPAPLWQMSPSRNRVLADVAFQADPNPGFASRFEGQALIVGGTSLAAPAWASLVSLANEARFNADADPIGIAAPALCEAALARDLPATAFRDTLVGNNGAFAASDGWDFPTGWGSPRVVALIDALTASPPRPLSSAEAERGILLTPARDDVGALRAQFYHQCARAALRLQGRNLAAGDYVVAFNDAPVASFTVGASGRTSVVLSGLDPRGVELTVARVDGDLLFAGQFPGLGDRNTRVVVDLESTGLVPEASGVALYQRRHGRERFVVRLKSVPPGVYNLHLGDAVMAPLTVPDGKSSARVSFNVIGATGGEYQPLNPVCGSISVLRDGVTVLDAESNARGVDICE